MIVHGLPFLASIRRWRISAVCSIEAVEIGFLDHRSAVECGEHGVAPEFGKERAPMQEPNAVVGAPVELVEGDEE